MSDEINPDLTALLAEALGREVYGVIVVRSEHDHACPGGGDYCASHCPVPVQDYGDVDEVAAHLAEQITAAGFGLHSGSADVDRITEERDAAVRAAKRADSLAPDTAGENNNPRRQGDA